MLPSSIVDRIKSLANDECGAGVSMKEVFDAEHRLKLRFPASYRSFLLEVGWAAIGHSEIYGLGPDVPPHLELVAMTTSERSDVTPALPRHLLPIQNDGFGNHFCLDTSALSANECPVVFWNHELGKDQVPERISESFWAWIRDVLESTADTGQNR
jgi:hypothetical protein